MNVFYTNTMGELYNSPRKFKEGTIAISGEDQKQYCYTGNEWVMIGTTTNNLSDNSTTFQTGMNLYDFNKNIMIQMDPINEEELNKLMSSINEISEYGMYYMLLCKDYNYYTIFHKNIPPIISTGSVASMVIILCQELGSIVGWEKNSDNAIEIWINIDNESYCFYLFQYDAGIVECN